MKLNGFFVFFILSFSQVVSFAQETEKQANTTGSEICADAPYHIMKYDSLGNLNPLPVHIFVHGASCVGCNNELMNVVIKIKNASDTEFQDTVLFNEYSEEEFNSLFVNKSYTDTYLDIQSFDESLPVKSDVYTIDFTSHSHTLPATTYVDITHDYWWFTIMIPAEKLVAYDNVIDLEVYCELDWDTDVVTYLRVFRKESDYPSIQGWYRGDVHYHGLFTQNDAEVGLPLDATKIMAKYCGLDWITITDHSCDYDNYGSDVYSNWNLLKSQVTDLNSTDTSFLFIQALEQTVKNSADDQIHSLVYPSWQDPLGMNYYGDGDGDMTGTSVTVDMLVDSLIMYNSFVYAAHPFAEGDELSAVVDGSVWNIGHGDFSANDSPHQYFGTVICNDLSQTSDIFSQNPSSLLKPKIVGGEIFNMPNTLKEDSNSEDPWDVMHSGEHGFAPFPQDDEQWVTNRFMQNLEVVDSLWEKGLETKNNDNLIENWKFYISAGSDAHGSFNYSTTDFVYGVYGYIHDDAIGKLSTLVYCPEGMGENAANVLKAYENGNAILSSGPIISFEIDTDSENSIPEIIIGNDTCLDFNLIENSRLSVFSASSDEYGEVVSKKIIVKTETENLSFDLPLNTDNWEIDFTELLFDVFGDDESYLDQWFLIRAEMITTKTYPNYDIYRCSSMNFYSYTNPVWLKINSPNSKNDLIISGIKVYPNPANDFINVKVQSDIKYANLLIYNNLGQVVLNKTIDKDCKIDISDLKSGVYTIIIQSSGELEKTRLVVM
ncbi:MAG TPA: T9SS type A sorting domain-containing protein [Bacteroidales bacterium]|nr:T9SS type A sorting domain-containing protein [Bacteroidales bacterium]